MIKRVFSFQFLVFSKKLLTLIVFLLSISLFSQGYKIPEKPKLQTSVYDYTSLLSATQKTSLENKLIRYSDTTSTQIVVAIISSTEGEDISYLAAQWLTKWGLGTAKEDNGVLVVLAEKDRKIAISTGYGVEHLLTDFQSKRIIENVIIPEFKKGDYYAGLDKGSDYIFKTLNGEYQGTREKETEGFDFGKIIFIIIVIVFILISFGNRNNGGGRGYRKRSVAGGILEAIILSSAGRGSSGGFGGFGGSSGGGSFGGGGFGGGFGGGMGGGGGASGGW
ncbi:TPM domain-containing protein [Polaribacter sp. Asnod1-A03]|uniref:TPM domain-containing protein n=1 Tax=Polaribacter sp. Asnod1-A03 TaxID=3160581 RepID=UPI003869BFD9